MRKTITLIRMKSLLFLMLLVSFASIYAQSNLQIFAEDQEFFVDENCSLDYVDLSIAALNDEDCSGPLSFVVLVDLYGDGTYDLEYSSFLPVDDTNWLDDNSNGVPDVYLCPKEGGEVFLVRVEKDFTASLNLHRVAVKVENECDQMGISEIALAVKDNTPPEIDAVEYICDSAIFGGANPFATIDISRCMPTVSDNCSQSEDILVSFNESMAKNEIEISESGYASVYARDAFGNVTETEVFMFVPFETDYTRKVCVKDILGNLIKVDRFVVEKDGESISQNTNDTCIYDSPALCTDERFIISKQNSTPQEITVRDYLVQRAIQNEWIEDFQNTADKIASDMNADGIINGEDSDLLLSRILRKDDVGFEFAFFDSRFLTYDFSDGILSDSLLFFPFNYLLPGFSELELAAVQLGDSDGSYYRDLPTHLSDFMQLQLLALEPGKSETVSLRWQTDNDVKGFQMAFELREIDIENVSAELPGWSEANWNVKDDTLYIVYVVDELNNEITGEIELQLQISSQTLTNTNYAIRKSDILRSEYYVGDDYKSIPLSLSHSSPEVQSHFAVGPNPFLHSFTVSFFIDNPGTMCLSIWNMDGRLIKEVGSFEFDQGYNAIMITKEDFIELPSLCIVQLYGDDFNENFQLMHGGF